MGWFTKRKRQDVSTGSDTEKRSAEIQSAVTAELMHLFGVNPNKSRVNVNDQTAMSISTAYRSISIISNDIASLPKGFFERKIEKGREVSYGIDSPSKYLISQSPEKDITAYQFWVQFMSTVLLRGKGHAHIIRNPSSAAAIELRYLRPEWVNEYRADLTDPYRVSHYKIYGVEGLVKAADIFKIECLQGISPIQLHAESFGLAIAAKEFGASFYGQGPTGAGLLTTDLPLKDKTKRDTIASSFKDKMIGPDNYHNVMVLDNGLKFQPLRMTPNDASLVAATGMTDLDISRIYGVPPTMLHIMDKATFNNTEELGKLYVKHGLAPWVTQIEQQIKLKLVPSTQKNVYPQIDMDGLLRGDIKARAEYYDKLLGKGVLNANDVLEKEGKNPIEGGDINLAQVNQIPLSMMDEYGKKLINEALKKTNKDEQAK